MTSTTSTAACDRAVRRALSLARSVFPLELRDGIHGLPHWSRVWHHGRRIATALDLDPLPMAWFAFLHDSQRLDDGRDPAHGSRAADFAVRLRHQGVFDGLPAAGFERLCEAMRLHSDGHTTADDLTILACWDADRLDLGRVGIRPDPRRLCTPPARDPVVLDAAWRMSVGVPRRSPAPEVTVQASPRRAG